MSRARPAPAPSVRQATWLVVTLRVRSCITLFICVVTSKLGRLPSEIDLSEVRRGGQHTRFHVSELG